MTPETGIFCDHELARDDGVSYACRELLGHAGLHNFSFADDQLVCWCNGQVFKHRFPGARDVVRVPS